MQITNSHRDAVRLSFPQRLLSYSLHIFFKQLYHQFARAYDFVAWIVSLGAWRIWIQAVSPYLEGPRVLEIGFGPGHLQDILHQKEINIYGLDESRQMVQIAQRRLRAHGFQPNLIRGSAMTLPFADESFSQVVMTFPAEFILKSSTISEIRRILIRSGIAVILPIAWITGRKLWERLAAWINRITGEAPDWDPKALEPLKEAGFEVSWEMLDFPNSKTVLIRLVKV